MLVVRLLPPSDAICDQKGIIFSPLQGAIQYNWVNYGDMWTWGLKYRTSVNTSVSEETNKAWLELLTGMIRPNYLIRHSINNARRRS